MNKFKITQARDRLTTALSYGKDMESSVKVCISDAMQLLATVDEYANPLKRKVYIVDMKLHDVSGKMHCRVVDAITSENIISADLLYSMQVAKERQYEIANSFEVLHYLSTRMLFKRKP